MDPQHPNSRGERDLEVAAALGRLTQEHRDVLREYYFRPVHVPGRRLPIASQASGPQPVPGICGPAFAAGRDGAPVSQGRWLVSLTQWTAANPRPCHWISLRQAEPRYSR
jgi:hypothetical protein